MEDGLGRWGKYPTLNIEHPTSNGGSGWLALRLGLFRRRRGGAGWRRGGFPDGASGFGGGHGENCAYEGPEDAGEGASPIEPEEAEGENDGGGGPDDGGADGFGLVIVHRVFQEIEVLIQGKGETVWLPPAQP